MKKRKKKGEDEENGGDLSTGENNHHIALGCKRPKPSPQAMGILRQTYLLYKLSRSKPSWR
jgi:hypothetical protein